MPDMMRTMTMWSAMGLIFLLSSIRASRTVNFNATLILPGDAYASKIKESLASRGDFYGDFKVTLSRKDALNILSQPDCNMTVNQVRG